MLYHINGGYPAVDDGSELLAPVLKAEPRDDEAKKEMNKFNKFLPPTPNFKERVYYLDIKADKNGLCHAALINRKFDGGNGFGFYVSYKKSQLPIMVEWKNNAEGTYVVGIEPSNCKVGGRAKVRQSGELLFIKAGEIKKFDLEIGVLTGKKDIQLFERKIK